MKKLRWLVLVLILINLFNCAVSDLRTGGFGYVMTTVRFIPSSFTIKTIPDNTEKILVKVSGKGIDPNRPMGLELTRENNSGILANVPEGEKTVKATALDTKGNIIALGENSINVIPQILNHVIVTLEPVQATPEPLETTPTSAGATPISTGVTPKPILVTPEPVVPTPTSVGVTPTPVQATPTSAGTTPVNRIPDSQIPCTEPFVSPTPSFGGSAFTKQFNSLTAGYGYVMTTVRFPSNGFTIKTIPANTEKILVKVSGQGINSDNPMGIELTKENNSGILSDVPEGEKTVKATALDIKGNIVAAGENSVNIIPKILNHVIVTLEPVTGPLPCSTPSPSVSPTSPSSRATANAAEVVETTPKPEIAEPSVTPTPIIIETTKPCIVKIFPGDFPLTSTLESSIREAGCTIEFLAGTPSPTSTFVSSGGGTSGGNDSGGGGGGGGSGPVTTSLDVVDGPPIDNTVAE